MHKTNSRFPDHAMQNIWSSKKILFADCCILNRQLPHLHRSEIIAGHIQKLNHYDSKDYNKKN